MLFDSTAKHFVIQLLNKVLSRDKFIAMQFAAKIAVICSMETMRICDIHTEIF